MTREDFIKGMESETQLTNEEVHDIYKMSLTACSKEMKLVVIMEELAELQQEISKQIRGEGNRYDLLQEMADVTISMAFLTQMFDIPKSELVLATDVKLIRERDRRCKNEATEETNS